MKKPMQADARSNRLVLISVLAVFIAVLGLILAASVAHTPTTIPFLHLRPMDTRLRLLTLAIGYFGLLFGYANYLLTRYIGRPLSTFWVFAIVTCMGAVCLYLNEEPFKLALSVSAMAGLSGVIACFALRLTEPPLPRTARWLSRALLVLSPFMGLIGLLRGGLSASGLLVPSYWIGETLQLEFLTLPYEHAVMVGICFHLFVVMCLVGLIHQLDEKIT